MVFNRQSQGMSKVAQCECLKEREKGRKSAARDMACPSELDHTCCNPQSDMVSVSSD